MTTKLQGPDRKLDYTQVTKNLSEQIKDYVQSANNNTAIV